MHIGFCNISRNVFNLLSKKRNILYKKKNILKIHTLPFWNWIQTSLNYLLKLQFPSSVFITADRGDISGKGLFDAKKTIIMLKW